MTGRPTLTVEEDTATRRRAQREFSAPMVVEAGAGTGKTALLVARVVAWCMGPGWTLHEDKERAPEEIARRVIEGVVAITFTEAAAAEMARKIGEALAGLARGLEPVGWMPDEDVLPETAEDREKRAGLLSDEVHRLAVSTIHSFCQSLLSAYPLEANLHPRFVVDAEEDAIGTLVVEVVEEALRSLDRDPQRSDWEALAGAGIDPPQIAETLQYLVTNGVTVSDLERDPFSDDLARREADELKLAVRAFVAIEGDRFDKLSGSASKSISARDVVRDLAERVESLGPTPIFVEVAALANEASQSDLERISDWGRGDFNTTEARCLDDAGEQAGVAAARLSTILNRLAPLRPAEFTAARRVLTPLLHRVEKRRTARGIIGFSDLLYRATRLVESSPGIVRELCSRIDQLLVDEFQDTDSVQCRLVETLAFGSKRKPGLFVVGDPKQSIYAWRNADLAAYGRFVATVEENGGGRYPLVQNFRSVEPILDEVGDVIEKVMVEEDDVQPPFVPLLSTGERVGAEGFNAGGRTAVEHWVTWPPGDDDGPPEPSKSGLTSAFEAEIVAKDIRDVAVRDGVRWGDIAILLRATTAQEDLLEAFRKYGIPYEVAREKEFYKQREVVEAAALVRTVVDPVDTLALLTVLRSDVVGVPDAALAPLWNVGFQNVMARLSGPGGKELEAVLDCVSRAAAEVPSGLPAGDALGLWPVSLKGAVHAIAHLRASFEEDPPDRFVEKIRATWLAEASAAARFLGRFRRARLERFFTDLESRLSGGEGGIVGLARFLRQVVTEGQKGAVGGEPDLQANAVHVMTIHGAKGLDFKHVYLVQIHRKTGGGEMKTDPKVLPLAGRREYRVFGWPTPGFKEASDLKVRQSSAELIRLLYVAMTRAKDRLVISGGWNSKAFEKEPLQAQSFADLLDQRCNREDLDAQIRSEKRRRLEEGVRNLWFVPALGQQSADDEHEPEASDLGLRDLAEIRRQAEILAASRVETARRMERPLTGGASTLEGTLSERFDEEEDAPALATDDDRSVATTVGSAVHKIMEKLDLDRELSDQVREGIELGLSEIGSKVDDGIFADARERLGVLIDRIAGGTSLRRLGSVASRVVGREIAIVAPPDPDRGPAGAITGFVDLVYRDPDDDRLVVADYKTDAVETNEEIDQRVRIYEPQVKAYACAIREGLGLDSEPHVELWFLAADRIVRL
jgi:ATP-dependent helicase/nuclease subunit A